MIPQDMFSALLHDVDVVDEGTGAVVAHGAGGGVRENFGALLDDDEQAFRFVGPYYPGTGTTPTATEPLDITVLADQVVAAGLRAGAQRFPIVGLSLGAAVAVTAAVRHPEQVSALILTVGLAHPDVQSAAFTALWRRLDAAHDLEALAQLMIYATGTADVLTSLSDEAAAEAIRLFPRTYPHGAAAHAELAQRTDVRALLDRVAVPTLVVVGTEDRIVLPHTARSFAAIADSTTIEYENAGHIFTAGQAQRWSGDVHRFLHAQITGDR